MNEELDEETLNLFARLDTVLLRAMGPVHRDCVPLPENDEVSHLRFVKYMSELLQPLLVHGSKENPEDLSPELQERAFLFLQNQALLRRALEAESRVKRLLQAMAGNIPPAVRDLARELADELMKAHGKQTT